MKQEKISNGMRNSLLIIITVLLSIAFALADSYSASQPSHQTLYTDTITSKTDGSPVRVADSDGFQVTTGNVGIGTAGPHGLLEAQNLLSGANPYIFVTGDGTSDVGIQMSDINGDWTNSRVTWYLRNQAGNSNKFGISYYDAGTGTNTDRITLDTNGNVGIGTTTPAQKLDVNGQVHATGDICTDAAGGKCLSTASGSGTSQWVTSGSNIYYNSGNVGIGVDSPAEKLDTGDNTVRLAGIRKIRLVRSYTNIAIGSYVNIGTINPPGGAQPGGYTQPIFAKIRIWTHAWDTLLERTFEVSSVSYTGADTGWVEVPSTTSRIWSDSVGDNIALDARFSTQGGGLELRLRRLNVASYGGSITLDIETNGELVPSTSEGTGATVASGYLGQNSWKFPVSTDRFDATTNGLFILGNGNIGIGLTNPGARLQVRPAANVNLKVGVNQANLQLATVNDASDAIIPLDFLSDGVHFYNSAGLEKFTFTNNGNVGIGTTGPVSKLEVSGSASSNGVVTVRNAVNSGDVNHGSLRILNDAAYAIGNDARIMFSAHNTDESIHPYASMGLIVEGILKGGLTFNTRSDGGVYSEKVRIDNLGNVGIGTTEPVNLLQVGSGGGAKTISLMDTDEASHFGHVRKTGRLIGFYSSDNDGLSNFISRLQVDLISGNVGIGTPMPESKLEVAGNGIFGKAGLDSYLYFRRKSDGSTTDMIGSYHDGITSNLVLQAGSGSGSIIFKTNHGAAVEEDIRIKNGFVGIGTTNPGSKATIANGDVYVSTQGNGIILKDAADGSCRRVILNGGSLSVSGIIACPAT